MVSIESLRTSELFAGLTDEELALVAAKAAEETYQAGDEICSERGVADRLFILQCGRVEVCIHLRSSASPDCCVTVEEMERGRIFGWSSLVKQRRFTASARAIEPVRLITLHADEANALFDENAHIGFVVMKQLAEVVASRLQHTRELLEEQAPGAA